MTTDRSCDRWSQHDVLAEDAAPGPARRRTRFRLFRRNRISDVLRRRRDGLMRPSGRLSPRASQLRGPAAAIDSP